MIFLPASVYFCCIFVFSSLSIYRRIKCNNLVFKMLSFSLHCNVSSEKTDEKVVLYNHLSYICAIAYRFRA